MDEPTLIKKILSICRTKNEKIALGIGDDCALVKCGAGYLVLTSDYSVEGVHFTIETYDLSDIGYKAAAVTLSDIAAVGARPLGLLVSLALPADADISAVEKIYSGIEEINSRFGCQVIGGDLSASNQGLVLDTIGVGWTNAPRLRSHAKPQDLVVVTGTFGDSAAGFMILQGKIEAEPDVASFLTSRHKRPQPRLDFANKASALPGVHAMMDVSDGLALDLNRMAEASNVRMDLFSNRIPMSKELSNLAGKGIDVFALALSGGEDYELVLTCTKETLPRLEQIAKETRLRLTCIGEVKEGTGVYLDGAKLEPKGWDHFSK